MVEQTVKTYNKTKAYQRDLVKMQRDGWRVVSTTSERRNRGCMAAWMSDAHTTVVTYERDKPEH